MVRSASQRSTKYAAKIDGDIVNARITAEKEFMVEQIHTTIAQQVFLENKIKAYLEPIGFFGIQQHHYMNFGGELWRLTRNFSGQTLIMEAELKANKWYRRGLNPVHLVAIAHLFGVDLSTWSP
jgi:hypothetical protein